MQIQTGAADCGLFAIATATALCHGIPPSNIVWDQSKMRTHLLQCFMNGKMLLFPGWDIAQPCGSIDQEQTLSTVKVKVFCSCRLPSEEMMACCSQCGIWYHKRCENIPAIVFQRKAVFKCGIVFNNVIVLSSHYSITLS